MTEPIDDVGDFFKQNLAAQGIRFTHGNNAPTSYKRWAGKVATKFTMKADCNGGYSLNEGKSYPTIMGTSNCRHFKTGEYKLKKIGPYKVYLNGEKAYDYMYSKCKENSLISLTFLDRKKILRFPCNEDLPKRPSWAEIESYKY